MFIVQGVAVLVQGLPRRQRTHMRARTLPTQGTHFLHIDDFTTSELKWMLDQGLEAKKRLADKDQTFKPFLGHTMCMIFTKPSARTRISFETVRAAGRGAGAWLQHPAGGCTYMQASSSSSRGPDSR